MLQNQYAGYFTKQMNPDTDIAILPFADILRSAENHRSVWHLTIVSLSSSGSWIR